MKLVAVSDIHGAAGRLRALLLGERPFDVVVAAGDLTTFGLDSRAREVLDVLSEAGAPVLVVAGNMDPPRLERVFSARGVSINERGVLLGGVGFYGCSGAPVSALRTPNEITEEEIRRRTDNGFQQVAGSRVRVFVSHAPPISCALDRLASGEHVGSTAVREAIERQAPHLVVCGHIHEARGIDYIGATPVVNCGAAAEGYYAVASIGATVDVVTRP